MANFLLDITRVIENGILKKHAVAVAMFGNLMSSSCNMYREVWNMFWGIEELCII